MLWTLRVNFNDISEGDDLMKKKSGFTLIEMIIVISIMSIIGGCSAISVRYYKTIENKIEADYYCNAVVSFINNSKMYCRENSCSAAIILDIEKNEMKLNKGTDMIRKLTFSNKIRLDTATRKKIVIKNKGYSDDACTITLMDNKSKPYTITMRVGSEYVKITEKRIYTGGGTM